MVKKRVSRPNAFCVAVTLSGIIFHTKVRMIRNSPCTGTEEEINAAFDQAFHLLKTRIEKELLP
jgi:hypothetical protein